MSTGTAQKPQTKTQNQTTPATDTPNLNAAISATFKRITAALDAREQSIEELLPDFMKGQGKRLIARARQFWARGGYKLQECTEASFIGCVLGAAELGFAVDGRMCHAVPFNTKVKTPQGDRWESKAQLIVDYKGLIAVAKRHKLIQDAWARIVYKTDKFDFREEGGKQIYSYVPNVEVSRNNLDDARCILAVATHADGWIRVDFMPLVDVLGIRNRSKGYNPDKPSGPWHTDPGEMAKKTAIKRLLKTFSDDPGLLRAMEIDNDLDDLSDQNAADHGSFREGTPQKRLDDVLSPPDTMPEDTPEPDALEHTPRELVAGESAELPTKEPEPSAESDLLDEYVRELEQATTLGKAGELQRTYLAGMSTPESKQKVNDRFEMRAAAIRGKRGQQTNGGEQLFDSGLESRE